LQFTKLIPNTLKRRVIAPFRREIGAFLVDSGIRILGQYDPSTPPTRLHFVGNGDFKGVGYEFLRYFTDLGELKPHEDVLDIGCGVGRMALPLSRYLKSGSYKGIDVVTEGIDWCQRNISCYHPNFEFVHVDLHNHHYNSRGTASASTYRFPYPDESFDFVFATSVFTHLLPNEAENYLREIGRLLRPGGRLLSTWFVLTDNAHAFVRTHNASPQLIHPYSDGSWVTDAADPEGSIGHSEELIQRWFTEARLQANEPIVFGSWAGHETPTSYQDIVLARKDGRVD